MNKLPESFSGSRCLLYGFGRSGIALAKWLIKNGADVRVFDEKKTESDIFYAAEKGGCEGIDVFKGKEGFKTDFLFRTPGVRPNTQTISEMVSNGAVLSSEADLFLSRAKGKIYGITGSDGKTTTTTLTGKILENAFKNTEKRVFVGGNIGVPLVSFLDGLTDTDVTVAELSSFQLMTAERSPFVSAITNITENHLDYHTNMREYVAAKCRIFSEEGCSELVTNTQTLAQIKKTCSIRNRERFPKKITEISTLGDNADVFIKNGAVYLYGERVLDIASIRIPGFHNVENYMSAIGITKNDASFADVQNVAESFSGVPHRMELVREKDGVSYVNSSIDSTPSRSIATIRCIEKPLTVICGGYDKKLDYGELAEELVKRADNVVLTGDNAFKIKKALDKHLYKGYECNVYCEKSFETAVQRGAAVTVKGGTVLLSPASASFDAFANFEERGNMFKSIINSL